MATMAAEMLNDNSFYVSASTSPRRLSLENMCFYNVPASPERKSFKNSYYSPETEPITPRDQVYEDANTSFIEFEFETSRRFNVEDDEDHDSDDDAEAGDRKFEYPCKQQHQRKESLPAMAFADELFCDGKVMPLKPPPRFQYNNESSSTSGLSSPKSSVMKLPFPRRSLWNDDFDPFMAALDNVREENSNKIHRCAWSMSPLRAISLQKLDKQLEIKETEQKQKQNGLNLSLKEDNANSSADYSIWVPYNNGQKGCQETIQKSPIRLAEAEGVSFARRARLVKMGHEKPSKKKLSKGEGGKESEESCIRESKKKKVKKFLLRSASMGKTSYEEKAKEESEELPKQNFTRKLSFRSTGFAQYKEEKRVSEVANITLMQYRPNLFLCMGYGEKCQVNGEK